jgi:transmembrane sensor
MEGLKSVKPSAAVRSEAAAWVARLHGPNRTPHVETGLRRWLADDPEHAAAFELLTDTWEKSARLRRRPLEQVASWEGPGFRISFPRAALAAAATVVLAILATIFYLHTDAVTTGVGELRTLTLDDGSRVHLNTDTRVLVHYDKLTRHVSLERGEALFEVAKRPDWPFIVTAGGREIKALGTEFVVRRDGKRLSVVLMEGKVTVELRGGATQSASVGATHGTEGQSNRSPPEAETFTLIPGDRVTFVGSATPTLDRPAPERTTAWLRGEVALDNTSLADAVAEMNRYSHRRIVADDPALAAIRVSGIFQAGDLANFAQAVARMHHIKVLNQQDEIVLMTGETARNGTPQQ